MEKWAWPVIVFFGLALVIGATAYNDSKNPEAERVSLKNNPVITDESINNPVSVSDSDTSINERDSLLGKGYRDSESDEDPYAFNGGSRRHRKNNKGSKGRKASKSSKGRKSRKHNNKKSKSKNSKSF